MRGGFTLIRHRLRRRHLPPLGGRLGDWQFDELRSSNDSRTKSLPPHGGRWHGGAVTDEGEAKGLLYIANDRK